MGLRLWKVGSTFPYKDTFLNYEVGASSASEALLEAIPEVPLKVPPLTEAKYCNGDAPTNNVIDKGEPK